MASTKQKTKTRIAKRAADKTAKRSRRKTRSPASSAAAAAAGRPTKKGAIATLLKQPNGASINEIGAATGWLAHSVRAALTGLRKQGHEIARSKDESGTTRYRIVAEA